MNYETVPRDLNKMRLLETLPEGNSVIAVNGDENVDLENTELYKKAFRPSLT